MVGVKGPEGLMSPLLQLHQWSISCPCQALSAGARSGCAGRSTLGIACFPSSVIHLPRQPAPETEDALKSSSVSFPPLLPFAAPRSKHPGALWVSLSLSLYTFSQRPGSGFHPRGTAILVPRHQAGRLEKV